MGHRFPETFFIGHFPPPAGYNETGYFFSIRYRGILSRKAIKGQNFEFFSKIFIDRTKKPVYS
jgi:hypothetical protein